MHAVDYNDLHDALRLGNTEYVGATPAPQDKKTGKINPQVTKLHKKDGSSTSIFHIKPVYYETLSGHWRPLSEVCSFHGNHKVVMDGWQKVHPRYINWLQKRMELIGGELLLPTWMPKPVSKSLEYVRAGHIGLTTLTAYPDPDPETTTVDGVVGYRNTSPPTYDDAHDDTGSGVDAADSSGTNLAGHIGVGVARQNSGGRWVIDRGFLLFDSSSIGSDSIDDATVSLYDDNIFISNGDTGSNNTYYIVTSTPASNTTLAVTDYQNSGDSIDNPTINSNEITGSTIAGNRSAYQDFTLNATGEGNVSTSGVSKFGFRHGDDEGTSPGWTVDTRNSWLASSADTTGTTKDPKLVVNHSAAGGGEAPAIFFGANF